MLTNSSISTDSADCTLSALRPREWATSTSDLGADITGARLSRVQCNAVQCHVM